jgi:hypothetical protein
VLDPQKIRMLSIYSSFVQRDLEKAVYRDNEKNRKLGRVGKDYSKKLGREEDYAPAQDPSPQHQERIIQNLESRLKRKFKGVQVNVNKERGIITAKKGESDLHMGFEKDSEKPKLFILVKKEEKTVFTRQFIEEAASDMGYAISSVDEYKTSKEVFDRYELTKKEQKEQQDA